MKASTRQVKAIQRAQDARIARLRLEFVREHIPRLYRLLMEAFPAFRTWFGYMIAENEDDETKLTLLKGKKVVARNFVLEEKA